MSRRSRSLRRGPPSHRPAASGHWLSELPQPMRLLGEGNGRAAASSPSGHQARLSHVFSAQIFWATTRITRLQQVTPDTEEVLDEPLRGQKSLRLTRRFELAHLPLTLPRRLVGDLGSVVRVLVGAVYDGGHDFAMGGAIASQLVGSPSAEALDLGPSTACGRIVWRLSDHVETGRGYRSHHHLDPPRARGIGVLLVSL